MKFPVFPVLVALCASPALVIAQPKDKAKVTVTNAPSAVFSPIQLRGYGVVSGALRSFPGGASLLRVETQNPAKAQLLQAKFISDYGLSPDVKSASLTLGNLKVSYQQAQNQGVVAALRDGKTVFLLTATTPDNLAALVKTLPPSAQKASRPEIAVPMWLDRWDKFSFRHYYRAWELPPNTTTANYDFTKEFDYAKAQDRAGFVFWNDTLSTDTAENMMNKGWWDWAGREAKQRNLPVGLNSMLPATTWLLDRYRDQTQPKMPDFTGNLRDLMSPFIGGQGDFSWSSTAAKDAQLGLTQATIRQYAKDPNLTTILEPHGELRHGPQDIFLEYGAVADAGYRRFLAEKYGSPATLAARWGQNLKAWDDVRVPEVASFTGWGPQALDLGGLWRVGYEELTGPVPSAYYYDRFGGPKSKPAPDAWYQPNFDDSSWPELRAPGNDKQFFLVKRPAVFRRSFEISPDWQTKNPRTWLYLWDLNGATNEEIRVFVNGREMGRSKIAFFAPHWGAIEVTAALQSGQNSLALRLPSGHISYKTYLSPTPPRQYPNLGAGLNAQWVDFSDFIQWSRVRACRDGVEMIRQVAPNQQIVLMAPTDYADGIKELATQYGGEFHDTGFMGAFWADYPSSVMRGADLPFSLEPGGPAADLNEWKKQMGYYQTEGIQGIDYFIHIGDILWKPEIKAHYESIRQQLLLLGQSHYAKAQVGVLYSDRTAQLTGYPWGASPNTNLAGGYWAWNTASVLRGTFAYDGLTQSSFARGEADPYRVVVDTNTSIMDEPMVAQIEKWVRAGGTFVTIAQTGRHTSEKPDAWPIARLTGYHVTKIDALTPSGEVSESGTLQVAPDQKVFDATWNGAPANGLHLEKVASDARNLLLWNDGTVAAGIRPLGKGFIVQLGAKFTGTKINDRIEPGGNNAETQRLRKMLVNLLDWRGVPREAAHLTADNERVWLRPAVTNNGLYDTWTLFNWSSDQTQTVSIVLDKAKKPTFALDARDGKPFPLTSSGDGIKLENISLGPLETRVFLTPRGQMGSAPSAWFDLQRKWWRGTKTSAPKVLPAPTPRFARDLSDGWKFQTFPQSADVKSYLAVKADDQKWTVRPLNIWNTKETGGQGHGVFRKTFTVPTEWNQGRVSLWITSWWNTSFVERGRVWLDGEEVKPLSADAYVVSGLSSLKAGSVHTLAVEVQSAGVLAGLRGQAWISYEPTPTQKIDLASAWQPSLDGLNYAAPIAFPGPFNAQMLRRRVFIDAKYRGQNAVIIVDGSRELVSVLINGKLVRRHHHGIGERWSLNLTPFVKFGAENDIEIVRWENPGAGQIREVFLGFYDPKFYP